MVEKATGKEGVVVNVTLPLNLVKELDHIRADTRERRNAVMERMLRYALEHKEEVLAGWKSPRGSRGKRLPSLTV